MKVLDEKILDLLCIDFRINEISKKLKCSSSYIEKRISYLKDFYNVKTIHGLVYKHLTK